MHPLLRVLGVALVSGFAQAYTVRPLCTAGNSPGTAATARASSPELRSCPPGLGATPGLRALPLRPKGTSTQPEPNFCFGATTPWLGRREASQLAIATVLGGSNVLRPEAASAMTIRQLKRALVNMIRVREGSGLLLELLNENLLDGFQDGVKLLVADTELRSNVKVACQGLIELNRESSVRAAEDKGDRIVSFITQVVEYDGMHPRLPQCVLAPVRA